jgi:hypothetical protein
MSSPNDRLATEAEEAAYDAGLVDGRIEERQRIFKLLTLLRGLAENHSLTNAEKMKAIWTLLKEDKK